MQIDEGGDWICHVLHVDLSTARNYWIASTQLESALRNHDHMMGLREQLQETSIFDGQNMICHSFPFHHPNDTRLVIVDVWGILGRSGKPPRGRKPAAKTYEDLNVVLTRSNV